MTKILIASGNQGKVKEMLEVLSELPLEFVSLADLKMENDVEETGITHEENALLKANYFYEKTGLSTIGEDSGITVSALEGELGIHTRRWGAGENASDEEWLKFFLKRLENEPDRRAKFTCTAAFVYDDNYRKHDIFFTGETNGVLTNEPKSPIPHGIPISSLFIPEGQDKVYAALNTHEKNQVSHRGKAMSQLKEFLAEKFLK